MEADRHMLQPDIGVMRASFSGWEDAVGYAADVNFCALVYGDSPILEGTTSPSAANIAGEEAHRVFVVTSTLTLPIPAIGPSSSLTSRRGRASRSR